MTYIELMNGAFGGSLPEFPGDNCASRIDSFFAANGVGVKVVDMEHGPVVTKYIVDFGSDTDHVSKVENLRRDLGIRLGVGASRVYIGETEWNGQVKLAIEVPNRNRIAVPSGTVIPAVKRGQEWRGLRVCLGVDTSGKPYTIDLHKAPHVLVAGQSGSGKSVFLNSMICGLLANYSPSECHIDVVDPKGTEFNAFCRWPAMLDSVDVHHADDAVPLLGELVDSMKSRMEEFGKYGVCNLPEYGALCDERGVEWGFPYRVVIIDEFYDMMMNYGSAFEDPLSILAAKARSCGIHLVLATQRPSADVIRGALKANLSTRIALKVSSRTDSQVIIDRPGAESLCGRGDMLYCGPDGDIPLRLHGCMLTKDELEELHRRAVSVEYIDGFRGTDEVSVAAG